MNSPDDAEIWGLEAAFEKQLTFLPGALGGFGVFANYTYTDSSKTELFRFLDPSLGNNQFTTIRISGVPFEGSPKHSGTAALTYNGYGLDASLSYTAQARRLVGLGSFNLDQFAESYDSLDFRAEYRFQPFGSTLRIWVEGSDLLKGTSDPDVVSSVGGTGPTPKIFTGGNFFGGRAFSIGLGLTF